MQALSSIHKRKHVLNGTAAPFTTCFSFFFHKSLLLAFKVLPSVTVQTVSTLLVTDSLTMG